MTLLMEPDFGTPASTNEETVQVEIDGVFPNWITHIRFPYFKNIQPNTRIDFSCPITALVGPNGTGKIQGPR